jgi:Trk-type K+ transport system membrane component
MARANCWPPSSPASCRVRQGFNSLDIAQLNPTSLLATDLLMFVDGGSAGTAGGIKITTFGLLAFVIWAELRGEPRVNIGHRRLAESAQRQVISITMIGVVLVAASTYALFAFTPTAWTRCCSRSSQPSARSG